MLWEFKPGDRVVYTRMDLAVPGTLVSKNDLGNWRINWDDGLATTDNAFSEDKLILLVCETGS
jgi:hypothetical protein